MRHYSITILCHAPQLNSDGLLRLEALRKSLPFAQIYFYGDSQSDAVRHQAQKLDVILRRADAKSRFHLIRRMLTEVDSDVYAYLGDMSFPEAELGAMLHQLVEARVDMVAAANINRQLSLIPEAGAITARYSTMCHAFYGVRLQSPLSSVRVFSRRFVKSFIAFDRGFPMELEWAMHALELDIPTLEHPVEATVLHGDLARELVPTPRRRLSHLVMHLQSRPLKWFGLITGVMLIATLIYKLLFCLTYFGLIEQISQTDAALATGCFAILTFISALSGLALHSLSHQKRELKRLHFQSHSVL